MQVSPCRAPNAGLLTAGAMFAYSAMLLWGALSDEPPDDVCSMHNSTGSNGLRVLPFSLCTLGRCAVSPNYAVRLHMFLPENMDQ